MRTFLTRSTILLLLSFPSPAMACQCNTSHWPYKAHENVRESASGDVNGFLRSFGDGGTIFEGVVEKQVVKSMPLGEGNSRWLYRVVTIRASRVYHGPQQVQFVVKTGVGGGDCGFDFETGEKYLVFATPAENSYLANIEKSVKFETSVCSPTGLIEYSGPRLRVLRGDPSTPEDLVDQESYWTKFRAEHTANVCGRVIRSDGTPASGAYIQLVRERHDGFPPRGVPTRDWSTYSNPDGTYCLEYVPRGRYFLSAQVYDGRTDTQFAGMLSRFWRPLPIRVEASKSVSDLTLVLHRDLLYSTRKHALLSICVLGAIVLLAGCSWLLRRRAVG
jgi:hypothetical protein